MGIEPTPRTAAARGNGFEDRGSHQAPSASAGESTTRTGGGVPRPRLADLASSLPVRIAALALLVAAAYGSALAAGTAWDDGYLIGSNQAIRSLDRPWRFFTDASTIAPSDAKTQQQYRPLRTLAFALQYAVFGGAAWGFHLVSILLHGLAAFLVARLTAALFGRGAWLAGTVWLLHPAVSENVLYLAAQGNLLCLDLALLALLAHLRARAGGSPWHRAGAVVAVFAAMAAYEFGAVLPVLLVIADAVWTWRNAPSQRVTLARHLPYFVALAAFLALRFAIVGSPPRDPWWEGSWTRAAALQLGLWLEGWRLTFLPLWQLPRYLPPDVPAWAPAPLAVLVHLALAGVVVRAALTRAWRMPAACIVWWYAAQAPTSNLIVTNLGYMFAPRFLFLALVLPVAAVSAWLAGRPRGRAAIAGAVAAALVAAALVRVQAGVWHSSFTVNQAIVDASPWDFGGHYRLAWSHLLAGDLARARHHAGIARSVAPTFALGHLLGGEIELRAGDLVAAHTAFRRTLELQPGAVPPKVRLAETAAAAGQREAAAGWLATIGSLDRLDPAGRARAELARARVEAALGDASRLEASVDQALAGLPNTGALLYECGMLLAASGRRERGLELLRGAAERIGLDHRGRVGDLGWIDLAALGPQLPLTARTAFASVPVPEVGP